LGGTLLVAGLTPLSSHAQTGERWFQIEVSVFSNERQSDREEEFWQAEQTQLDYPPRLRRLQTLIDLLMIPRLQSEETYQSETDSLAIVEDFDEETVSEPSAQEIRQQIIAATGPFPPDGGDTYRFPDFDRDAFVQLPASESDFQQTNRALERSPEYRLLFHGLWRQPMPDPGGETPVIVRGGELFGNHHELEGSLSLHFNSSRDRVVIDADLWLSEFSTMPGEESWQLPAQPETIPASVSREPGSNSGLQVSSSYSATRVYHMEQSRDMRSNEFHYLDHPALGIVVTVFPYDVPPLQTPDSNVGSEFEVLN